jgi:hypothetical protein
MAYTPAPEQQTYNTHRIPLAQPIRLRIGNNNWVLSDEQGQDAGMVNILPVKYPGSDEVYGVTRPALDISELAVGETGNVRGIYVWEKTINPSLVYYFCVCDTKVYTSTDGATWTHVTTIASSTNPVRFAEFIDATNVKKLVMVTGTEGYVFTSNAAGTARTLRSRCS